MEITAVSRQHRPLYSGPLPQGIWEVLDRCWYQPPSISSDFARAFAKEIALASSLDWITVIAPDGSFYSTKWHATILGLAAFKAKDYLCLSSSSGQ